MPIVCFNQISPHFPPILFLPTTFTSRIPVICFWAHHIHLMLSVHHGCRTIYWNLGGLSENTFLSKTDSLPHLPWIAIAPQLRLGLHEPLLHPQRDSSCFDTVQVLFTLSQTLWNYVCNIPVISSKYCLTAEFYHGLLESLFIFFPKWHLMTLYLWTLFFILFYFFSYEGKGGHVHMSVFCL